jgi:hypothetical protein
MATKTMFKNAAGKRVPSVSTITGLLDKPALMYWAHKLGLQGVADLRGHRDSIKKAGTLMHELIEECLKSKGAHAIHFGEIDIDKVYQKTDTKEYTKEEIALSRPIFERACKLLASISPFTTGLMEYSMISEEHQFGGRLDWYGVTQGNGPLTLIDFKSGKDVYLETIVQLSAYRGLLLELKNRVDKVRVVRVGGTPEDGEEIRELSDAQLEAGWNLFLHLRKIHDLKKIAEGESSRKAA